MASFDYYGLDPDYLRGASVAWASNNASQNDGCDGGEEYRADGESAVEDENYTKSPVAESPVKILGSLESDEGYNGDEEDSEELKNDSDLEGDGVRASSDADDNSSSGGEDEDWEGVGEIEDGAEDGPDYLKRASVAWAMLKLQEASKNASQSDGFDVGEECQSDEESAVEDDNCTNRPVAEYQMKISRSQESDEDENEDEEDSEEVENDSDLEGDGVRASSDADDNSSSGGEDEDWEGDGEIDDGAGDEEENFSENACNQKEHITLIPPSKYWGIRFEELRNFNAKNGHCNVPLGWSENKSLGRWAGNQRQLYRLRKEGKKSSMTDERVAALEKIGFKWRLKALSATPAAPAASAKPDWQSRLEELSQYKAKHGHCNVSQYDSGNKALGGWVHYQRQQYRFRQQGKKSFMTEERVTALKEIGFEWRVKSSPTRWKTRLEELRKYKAKHGHCNVPRKSSENKLLGFWVSYQRKLYGLRKEGKKSAMTDEHVTALEETGFKWRLKASAPTIPDRKTRLVEHSQYKAKQGHCNVSQQLWSDKWSKNKSLGIWVGTQRKQSRSRHQGNKSPIVCPLL